MAGEWTDETWDEFVDESAEVKGHKIVVRRRNLERQDGDWQDPNFFADDYTVAAATGFQVWEGSLVMIKLLGGDLGDELRGKRVVELGSGTGLAGLCAAACGCHALLSDIKTVTDQSLRPNVERNTAPAPDGVHGAAWRGAGVVGEGTATCMALDWTRDIDEQAAQAAIEPWDCDVVLAAECVWLAELVHPFVTTVLRLLSGRNGVCYCIYRDRAKQESQTFAGMQMVVEDFESGGCNVELLHRLAPDLQKGPGNDVLVYRISLKSKTS